MTFILVVLSSFFLLTSSYQQSSPEDAEDELVRSVIQLDDLQRNILRHQQLRQTSNVNEKHINHQEINRIRKSINHRLSMDRVRDEREAWEPILDYVVYVPDKMTTNGKRLMSRRRMINRHPMTISI